MLYLNAAIAVSGRARTRENVATAIDHVAEAGEVASRQGPDGDADYTQFGPTNVELHRVDVLTRFEDGWSALEARPSSTTQPWPDCRKERQAQHAITRARARLLTKDRDGAASALAEAADVSLEEVAGRKSTVDLVRDVLQATPRPGPVLQRLATRCGLPA